MALMQWHRVSKLLWRSDMSTGLRMWRMLKVWMRADDRWARKHIRLLVLIVFFLIILKCFVFQLLLLQHL